tara:strand:- start:7628 stop:8557 length:930 start_codon:yes stop_codon:yes gene_type:complete
MEHIIYTEKPKLAKTTIKNYINNINKLYLSFNNDVNNITDLVWIYDKVNLMKFIDGLNTINTKKTYYTLIITLMNYDIKHNKTQNKQSVLDYWIDLSKKNRVDRSKDQLYSTKKEENIISMELYDTLLTKLTEANELQPLLLFSILKLYPIRNEVSTFVLSNGKKMDDNTNYLVINKNQMKFIRNVYKTADKYGVMTDIITDKPLKKLITKYITELDIKNNDYLFTFRNEPYDNVKTTQILQQYSNKYIKTKLSTTIIFKSVINDWILKEPRTKLEIEGYLEGKGKIRGTDYMTLYHYYLDKKSITLKK